MNEKHTIEIFSAGCPLCLETIESVKEEVGASSKVTVLDMHNADVAFRAKELGVTAVPSLVINGKVADCCSGKSINLGSLGEKKMRQKDLLASLIKQHKLLD